jgi:hypothetical protein
MSEKDKQAILDAVAKLDKGIDQQLKDTEWADQETLEEYNQNYGGLHAEAGRISEAQYRTRLRSVRANPGFVKKLKDRGISPEQFLEMEQGSPEAYAKAYSQGEDDYLDRLQGKGKGGGDPFFDPARTARPSPEQSARAKKAAKKGRGTDADVDAVLGALMGFDD